MKYLDIEILNSNGETHGEIAAGLEISREMSRLWRRRWLWLTQKEVPVGERLQDLPRPGSPATFSLEQITQLYAIAYKRNMPDIPLKPGGCVKHEFEYTRHGTQTLIASFNVATGVIALATVGDTRTEQDFAAHVSHLLAQFPQASKYHLVMD